MAAAYPWLKGLHIAFTVVGLAVCHYRRYRSDHSSPCLSRAMSLSNTARQRFGHHRGRTEFMKRAGINAPLEVDHLVDGPPEIHPARPVEFRLLAEIEAQLVG